MPKSRARTRRSDAAAHEVLKAFRIIFGSVRRHFAYLEKACGIGGAQVWALAEIARRPGLRVGGLAETLAIHQSTASNLVELLARAGLARRVVDSVDRRVVRLELTARGKALLRRAPKPLEGVLPDALRRLPAKALARLRTDLGGVVRAMQRADARSAYKPLADL